MKIQGKPYHAIWREHLKILLIDQTLLPFEFKIIEIQSLEDAAIAIESMQVRGAPLIGATAAYGIYLAVKEGKSFNEAYERLIRTRPTAVNLRWALDEGKKRLSDVPVSELVDQALSFADGVCELDVKTNHAIGAHGFDMLRALAQKKGSENLNILTHCNAGWIATVDWGTALAPIYMAHDAGLKIHVWVDETRPRNQGASLTAWELRQHGVPHSVIVDNVGGHIMQHGLVDCCIVGADRVTSTGDVCNKIGTYLKALAAKDNGVPFYVALPSSTIDWTLRDGVKEIPIEERNDAEVTHLRGILPDGSIGLTRILPEGHGCRNYGFDVTPARLVTGLITERGICEASASGLKTLFQK